MIKVHANAKIWQWHELLACCWKCSNTPMTMLFQCQKVAM